MGAVLNMVTAQKKNVAGFLIQEKIIAVKLVIIRVKFLKTKIIFSLLS